MCTLLLWLNHFAFNPVIFNGSPSLLWAGFDPCVVSRPGWATLSQSGARVTLLWCSHLLELLAHCQAGGGTTLGVLWPGCIGGGVSTECRTGRTVSKLGRVYWCSKVSTYLGLGGGVKKWYLPAFLFLERSTKHPYFSSTYSEISKQISLPYTPVFFKLLFLCCISVELFGMLSL